MVEFWLGGRFGYMADDTKRRMSESAGYQLSIKKHR